MTINIIMTTTITTKNMNWTCIWYKAALVLLQHDSDICHFCRDQSNYL